MVGNLQVFLGRDVFNHYAATLQGTPELLWTVRVVMLCAVVAHIYSAATLVMRSSRARPVAYKKRRWLGETYAVRTMRVGGIILLGFIVYHLLHLTVGVEALGAAGGEKFAHCHWEDHSFHCDAYDNLVYGFQVWWIALIYMIPQVFLGMHLTHGVWSMTRTLGLSNPRFDGLARKAAISIGVLVTVGNIAIPLAVLLGFVNEHGTFLVGAN